MRKFSPIAQHVAVVVVLFVLAVLLQRAGGAYNAEFGGDHADEAPHYVTAKMVSDYVSQGFPGSPMRFAENYYLRYPKVAFGIWPPLFHVIAGLWMAVISPGRTSILIFAALLSAILGWILYTLARKCLPPPVAVAITLVFITLPAVQTHTASVMVDSMLAIFILSAAYYFGQYIESGTMRDSVLFGILASLALLTKYNAIALAFLPPLALLVSRRSSLLRTRAFWVSALIIATLCAPWYLPFRSLVTYASEPYPGWDNVPSAAAASIAFTLTLAGIWVGPAALASFSLTSIKRRRALRSGGLWVSMPVLVMSILLFHSLTYPVQEPRYMLHVLAPMLLCAGVGLTRLVRRLLPPGMENRGAWAVAGMILLLHSVFVFKIPQKENHAIGPAAQLLLSRPNEQKSNVLVSSNGLGEGMLIAEMANRERDRSGYILRASKLLAQSTWMGENYHALYKDADAVMTALDGLPIEYVITHSGAGRSLPHHTQLTTAIGRNPGRFQELGRFTAKSTSHSDEVTVVYRLSHPVEPPPMKVSVDMKYTLHRNIRN
jgi:hypothetical protein